MCEKQMSIVVGGFICYPSTDTIPDSLGTPTERSNEQQKNSPQKSRISQEKCNSSKSGSYRIISINVYNKCVHKMVRTTLGFFFL